MKAFVTTLALAALALSAQAADDAAKKPNSQQSKMAACQKEAGDKHLESKARQDYVNECLKAKPEAQAKQTQGEKLGACSKEAAAKGLKGDERNKYLSECASK
jgi:hypothetical protein